ncbi:MAG: molecular chaperone TorD family protein [Rhizobiaceae bacterium]|nr:molecular chaperone TorD family protein [Rhizobiaceae bacterium]
MGHRHLSQYVSDSAIAQRALDEEITLPVGSALADERDPVDLARSHLYGMLAVLFERAPTATTLAALAGVEGGQGDLGLACRALAEKASAAVPAALEREYFDLFIGVGRGELVPYGSYYLTGFLQEKPLARLRQDLGELGIERLPGTTEFEDHIATVCEILSGLADGRFGTPKGADERFFVQHLQPWGARFFADVSAAKASNFYKHVAAVGLALMAIEAEASVRAA